MHNTESKLVTAYVAQRFCKRRICSFTLHGKYSIKLVFISTSLWFFTVVSAISVGHISMLVS